MNVCCEIRQSYALNEEISRTGNLTAHRNLTHGELNGLSEKGGAHNNRKFPKKLSKKSDSADTMMEDSENTQENQQVTHEEIDLNDEDISSPPVEQNQSAVVSQHTDDSMSGKLLNAATTAGKTIVDISVTAAKVTEDTIHKVAEEVLHTAATTDQSGEGNASSPANDDGEEKKDEPEPVTSKVIHAATSAGKTVVDLSISAAKKTGDVLNKVVESASEVIHKHKSSGESKENPSPEAIAATEETTPEEAPNQEPVSAKVLHVASAAGKTVVDLSVSAATTLGEVINKVATSAGEALHKEKAATAPAEGELETSPVQAEGEVQGEAPPAQNSAEGSQGSRMWTSVRRMSEKVIHSTSSTISKAAASVQHHEGKTEAEHTDAETPTETERNRSGSLTQLWSSVRKTADTIVDSASAAYKAAEPVAISTATKVSHGAQTVWSSTKEKVFPSKKEDTDETGNEKDATSPEAQEEEKSAETEGEPVKSDVTDLEETNPRIVATSAEPEIVSSFVKNDDTEEVLSPDPSSQNEANSDILNEES